MVALVMKGFALVVVLGISAGCWAQSFNIDMDAPTFPELGGGVPSDSFGGAAQSVGRWNKIPGAGFGTHVLRALDGNLTAAKIVGPEGGGSGGHNIPINTGDYALLLNDARSVDRTFGLDFKFTGLQNGVYEVYTYLVSITFPSQIRRNRVTIYEAIGPQQMVLTGPMPGNQLIEGKTHTKHRVLVTAGEMNVFLQTLETSDSGWFNGIQVKQVVPEPTTLLAISIGLLTLIRHRRP